MGGLYAHCDGCAVNDVRLCRDRQVDRRAAMVHAASHRYHILSESIAVCVSGTA